jgi:hypothetical protein
MDFLFAQLYPFVLVIGLAGFGPQIFKLIRDPASADGLSVSTWLMWTMSWCISLGYGLTNLNDAMFILTAAVFMAAHGAVLCFILYRRFMAYARHNPQAFFLQPIYLRVKK